MSASADDLGAPRDGRNLRSERTRAALIAAYVDLLTEGHRSPGAREVALRAGAGARTVYNQFRDLEDLRAAAGAEVGERIAALELRPQDIAADAPFDTRLDLYLNARVRLLQMIDPYASAAQGRHEHSEALTRHRQGLVDASLDQLRLVFEPELAAMTDERRSRALRALHLVSCWPAWAVLRDELGATPGEAVVTIRETIAGILSR